MVHSRGLLGYWPLENNILDASGSGHNGVNFGSTVYAAGQIGRSKDFDGDDDYFTVGDSIDYIPLLNDPLTIALWANPDTIAAPTLDDRCVAIARLPASSAIVLAFGSTHHVQVFIGNTYDSVREVTPGSWYHLAVTYDGSDMRLYIDGILDLGPITEPLPAGDASTDASVGAHFDLAILEFDGQLDDVCIWNRTLGEADIRRVMLGMSPIS